MSTSSSSASKDVGGNQNGAENIEGSYQHDDYYMKNDDYEVSLAPSLKHLIGTDCVSLILWLAVVWLYR